MKTPLLYAFLFVSAISLASTAQAANLLVNGGFEEPVVGGTFSQLAGGNTTLTGWTIATDPTTGGGVAVVTSFDATAPSEGANYLALQEAIGDQGVGSISQAFATTVGLDYTLTFDYSALDFGSRSTTITYDVGGPDQTVTFTTQNDQIPWETESYTFTAAAATTTLTFTGDFFSGFWGASIDDVSVEPVPEPSRAVLSLVGIAALALRRHRQN